MRSAEILLAFQAQYEACAIGHALCERAWTSDRRTTTRAQKAITHQGQLYFQGQGHNEWFLEYMVCATNAVTRHLGPASGLNSRSIEYADTAGDLWFRHNKFFCRR
jgi:hypothetical protein